jgi:proline dehydrogenase
MLLYPVQAEATQPPPSSIYHSSSTSSTLQDLMNEDNRTALSARTTEELLVGLFVYKLCTLPWLVDIAPHVIQLAETMHLEGVVYKFVKSTFFRQFCGGETAEECVARMDRLAQSGIQCILDLSIEADLHLEQADVPDLYDELAQPLGKWWRQEQSADVVLAMTEQCVRTAARGGGGGDNHAFAAVKVTAFAPPELLLRLNQVITQLEQIFQAHQVDGYVGTAALHDVVSQVLPPAQSEQQNQQRRALIQYMHHHQPQIDAITFAQVFNLQGPSRDVWWASSQANDERSSSLSHDELEAYDRMVNRLDQVCSLAHRHRVGIMVDAEQSYFQEIIDHVAMNLQIKYNRRDEQDHPPTVYNTCKLKANRKKWTFFFNVFP